MDWIRRDPRQAAGVIAIVLGLVLAVVAAFLATGGSVPVDDDRADTTTPGSPYDDGSGDDALDPARVSDDDAATGSRFGAGPMPGFSGLGLSGSGVQGTTPSRRVSLTVTSSEPLGVVGYIVPSSADDSYGTPTVRGTRFSRTTTAYGPPDYARVFVQAGYSGASITCTVSVDGRVTDRRTATGRYAQAMCQG